MNLGLIAQSVQIRYNPAEVREQERNLIAGYVAGYPVTWEMFQMLKWTDEYARQGKRYPRPRRCRSKARMSKEWRDKA